MKLFTLLIAYTLLTIPVLGQLKIQSPALPFTEQLNSRYYEKSPVLHPSGRQLYFVRANDPANVGGINDRGDIWMSESDSLGNWGKAVNLGTGVNNEGKNTIIGFLADGQYMLIAEQYGNTARYSPDGISVSEQVNGKWQQPRNLTIPGFVKKSDHISGSVSADGTTMILSLESYGSEGVEDLYVSERQRNGNWGDLKNLGDDINSSFQEISGFLSSDKSFLVFASNRDSGIGSYDLWISRRQGRSWRKWTAPELLNDLVNSEGADYDFSYRPGSDYAFFTSTRNSDGYGDIKQVKIGTDSIPDPVVLNLIPNMTILEIKVVDAKNEKPLVADLIVNQQLSVKEHKKVSSLYGEVKFNVPDDEMLDIVVDRKGYLPAEVTLDMTTMSDDSVFQFRLEPLQIGNTVRLQHILFARASDEFLPEATQELELLLKMMRENPTVAIFLEGHTDSYGNPKSNLELSQHRVDAVKSYLVERGISAERIEGKGFGGTRPVADNASEETRQLNRRVEFRVTAN